MSPAEAFNTSPGNDKKVILVVDDEPGIREFLTTFLRSKNFKVLTAGNAGEAQSIWKAQNSEVHILLTDIIMPGCNGKVLAQSLLKDNPSLKVIFMSGYLPEELAEENSDYPFFKKPFHPGELLEEIRKVLH